MPDLDLLISSLAAVTQEVQSQPGPLGDAMFVGSGDSLSACLLAERFGHRAVSAGDVAWTGRVPPRCDTVIGVSHSGRTVATVQALDLARSAGLRTVAVTAQPASPLAIVSAQVVVAPLISLSETIPAAGYVALAMGVLGLCGEQIDGGFPSIAQELSIRVDTAVSFAARLPAAAPEAISVLTLPDMRSAGDFWSLKLIEATGLCARSVPLEEAGHVDYFVGPQSHLTIHLVGAQGAARHARLAQALAGNGQSVMIMTRPDGATACSESGDVVATAALGAYVAEEAALRWGRHPFRNGEVPMDARHIQVPM